MTMLVTGWVAIDDIETPFGAVTNSLGGSATCAALAGSLFTPVRLVAAVGEDFPDELRAKLVRPGIDISGLVTVAGSKTSRWGARYHYDMNNRDTWYPEMGISVEWKPTLTAEMAASCTTACIAAGHPVDQRNLIQSLVSPRATMVDTIKLFIDEALDDLRETMRHADFVTVNESEAREIAGMPSIARAARFLADSGPKGVIVKLGEYGAAFASKDDYFIAPGYPLENVIDPTGAGDAFAGGFMGYLDTVAEITPAEIRQAIIYGSTTASFAVEGFGPSRLLTLRREEVEARYREFRMLTHFEVRE
ncbi:MAG TPA: PfkB family carbohydrate kinase [Tepidiformaceae bacterium]|jgi:sugar/nucleoside kinase (ribokinase family)